MLSQEGYKYLFANRRHLIKHFDQRLEAAGEKNKLTEKLYESLLNLAYAELTIAETIKIICNTLEVIRENYPGFGLNKENVDAICDTVEDIIFQHTLKRALQKSMSFDIDAFLDMVPHPLNDIEEGLKAIARALKAARKTHPCFGLDDELANLIIQYKVPLELEMEFTESLISFY